MATNFKIKVAIADDCKISRELLKANLEDSQGFSVIICVPNGKKLLEEIKETPPMVAVIDVRMDVMDGIDASKEIRIINPDIRIIAWSHDADIQTIFKMLDAGATAFLDKETGLPEFKKCIIAMHKEGYFYNQYFTKSMHESILRGDKNLSCRVGEIVLTKEDVELGKLICQGMTCKMIADTNFTCLRQAQIDVRELLDKTKTHNIALFVRFAIQNGIISLKDYPNLR